MGLYKEKMCLHEKANTFVIYLAFLFYNWGKCNIQYKKKKIKIKSTIGAEASMWQKKTQLYRDIVKKRGIGHNNNCVCKI